METKSAFRRLFKRTFLIMCNGYDRLNTAHMRSSPVAEILLGQWFEGLATVSNGEGYIFYSYLLDLLIK
jgi:hypothetical protein